jgi:hypothetical protein
MEFILAASLRKRWEGEVYSKQKWFSSFEHLPRRKSCEFGKCFLERVYIGRVVKYCKRKKPVSRFLAPFITIYVIISFSNAIYCMIFAASVWQRGFYEGFIKIREWFWRVFQVRQSGIYPWGLNRLKEERLLSAPPSGVFPGYALDFGKRFKAYP